MSVSEITQEIENTSRGTQAVLDAATMRIEAANEELKA
jgi:hypothetical protein